MLHVPRPERATFTQVTDPTRRLPSSCKSNSGRSTAVNVPSELSVNCGETLRSSAGRNLRDSPVIVQFPTRSSALTLVQLDKTPGRISSASRTSLRPETTVADGLMPSLLASPSSYQLP